jgi:molybdopterin molybdotransferase
VGGAGVSVHDHRDRETGAPLISLEEAVRRTMAGIAPLPPTDTPLGDAHDRVLAEDIRSPIDLPPFPSSAMDGYAIRSADVDHAGPGHPVGLRIDGAVRLGRPADVEVRPGGAVAVPTGGPVPAGADAVVPVEHAVVEGTRLMVLRAPGRGRHVRPAGEDVAGGELLVPAGRRLTAPDLGLLASAGLAAVPVRPRARVGIVSTGDELVDPGQGRGDGRIYDANSYTLQGAVREAGGVPIPLGRVPDDPDRLAATLVDAVPRVDVLVSSGGVSVGERDPVKRAFGEGGGVEFVEVAMQPGKPQAFGTIGGRPYFGLPGNPVSVFVSFEVFVRPALLRMMGRPGERPSVTATVEGELGGPSEKVRFARVRLRRRGEEWRAGPTGGWRSNLLATVSRANGLAVLPVGVERLETGDRCRVLVIRDPDEP